jgi:hypothetical protein
LRLENRTQDKTWPLRSSPVCPIRFFELDNFFEGHVISVMYVRGGRYRAQAGKHDPARRRARVVRVKGLVRVVLLMVVVVVGYLQRIDQHVIR